MYRVLYNLVTSRVNECLNSNPPVVTPHIDMAKYTYTCCIQPIGVVIIAINC